MRKRAPLFALGAVLLPLLGLAAPAAAEEEKKAAEHEPEDAKPALPSKKNVVFADLGLHVIGLGFQRTVAPHVAVAVSGGLYDPWTVTEKVGDIRGWMIRARPYFYATEEAPRGLWISPFIQGGSVHGTQNGVEKSGGTGALGASIGYALLLGNIVHLSLGLGGQLHFAKLEGSAAPPSFYTAGLHLDATLGFAF
ncbi:MAG: DUF3575 domain-containing protein [Myxococcales bacterium]|jgi:hypothetical protein|nr:DUF3575 domain-containing protein [Myxococcales bacterium]MBL0194395.1 DUF3575 domain-containing protein [Myxococcales bacterium]HQY62048.1 DUF3575 domain-containing protein [Polyangiaceae bacterium]